MNTITIKTFNEKEYKTVDVDKLAPKYNVDFTTFENNVQCKYDGLKRLSLQQKISKAEEKFLKALKNANMTRKHFDKMLEEYEKDMSLGSPDFVTLYNEYTKYAELKDCLKKFEKIINARYEDGKIPVIQDRGVTYYTWAIFNFTDIELTITGIRAVISDCIAYGNNFFGSEKWSTERKQSFTAIKKSFVDCLSTGFDYSNTDGKQYKNINVGKNFPSKQVEIVINAIYGYYDNKKSGISITHMKESQATKQLILAFLAWQGCEIDTKKIGVKKLTAFDV